MYEKDNVELKRKESPGREYMYNQDGTDTCTLTTGRRLWGSSVPLTAGLEDFEMGKEP